MTSRALVARFGIDTSSARRDLAETRRIGASHMNDLRRAIGHVGEEMSRTGEVSRLEWTRVGREVRSVTGETARLGSTVAGAGRDFVGFTAQGAASALGIKAAWVATGAAITALIAAAGVELARWSDIIGKAREAEIGTTFFQAFNKSADEAVVRVETLQRALVSARASFVERDGRPSTAMRAVADLESWNRGMLIPNQQGTEALATARSNEERIRIVLELARDLERQGQRLASIGLLEQVFGNDFADQVRRGNIELGLFVSTLDRLNTSGIQSGAIVSPETLRDLDELNRRLAAAGRQMADNLAPITRDVAGFLASAYAEAVKFAEALATAARVAGDLYTNVRRMFTEFQQQPSASAALQSQTVTALETRLARDPGMSPLQRRGIEEQLARARAAAREAERQAAATRVTQAPFDDAELRRATGDDTMPRGYVVPPEMPADLRRRRESTLLNPPSSTSASGDTIDRRTREVSRFIESLEKQNRVLQAEAQTQGATNEVKERALALARIGPELTDAQRRRIEDLAGAHGRLRDEMEKTRRQQEAVNEAFTFLGASATSFMRDLLKGGDSAEKAIQRLTDRLLDAALQSALMGQGPLGGIGGMQGPQSGPMSGIGGIFGGLLSSVFGGMFGGGLSIPFPLFADGGLVKGPGSSRSDSILARLSAGEYVVSAEATREHLPMLAAINSGTMRGFADGGLVGSTASPAAEAMLLRDGANAPVSPATDQARASGGTGMNVKINNNAPVQVTPRRTSGGLEFDISMIEDALAGRLGNNQGALSNVMAGRQGMLAG